MKIRYIIISLLFLLATAILIACHNDDGLVVLYVPLDNRPINYDNVLTLGDAAGVRLLTPPPHLLGRGSEPGQNAEIMDWLERSIAGANACVISLDMLLYGGLAPSRTHTRDAAEIMLDMQRLEEIAGSTEAPVYAFATVLRSAASSASPMQPVYFEEFGDKILHLSQLSDLAAQGRAAPEQLAQLEQIKNTLPGELLGDYLQRRETNLAALKEAVHLASQGTIQYLVLGRDDTTPYSFTRMDMRKLKQSIIENQAENNVDSYPGADELGALLLARAVNQLVGETPRVFPHWAAEQGHKIVALYEDISLGENVNLHIKSGGGELVADPKDADIILVVNTPEEKVTEAAKQSFSSTPGVQHLNIAREINNWLNAGKPVAVADVAYANGADRELMTMLAKEEILPGLSGYAGCNTAGNSIGWALAQGLIYSDGKNNSERQNTAHREILLARLIEDWGYQSVIRPEITKRHTLALGTGTVLDEKIIPGMQKEILTGLNDFIQLELEETFQQTIRVNSLALPWQRLFEIRYTLTSQ